MYTTGRKNRTIKLANGETVNLNYYFANLLWVFNFTSDYKYAIVTENEDGSVTRKAITKAEATERNSGKVPKPSAYERYSFWVIVALAVAAWLVRTFTN